MDGVTDEDLKNGKEGMKVGKGWSDMKYSLDLEEGQEQKLFWHRGYKRFIVVNFHRNQTFVCITFNMAQAMFDSAFTASVLQ
ncbi:hypothetical protein Bca52824_033468 [Brassica carinata]|uniref:Uncharacterized protein n=1 Tax=Brassica carinata TaxID=52824 RepID=A0A8X7V7C9_BRACI|nr:hypothetical protein Bca52824_033468 [Brassica carinata]